MYKREGMGNGFTIKKTPKGFLVESWTAWSGQRSGFKALVYYSKGFPKAVNLDEEYNQYFDNGQIIYEHAKNGGKNVKVLSRGSVVR